MKPIHTLEVHIQYSRHNSFTGATSNSYKQVSLWSITCILDVVTNPH